MSEPNTSETGGNEAEKEAITTPPCSELLAEVTPGSLFKLGNSYESKGNYHMAEKVYQDALKAYKANYGPEHQSTLVMMTVLANLYADKGDASNADRLYREQLQINERLW